ncbi:hypothetical protein D9M71_772160 [compost metagenome]
MQHHLLVLLGGDDDHRHRRRLVAQVDQAVQAMHAGHVQVEEDEVQVVVLLGQGQGAVQVGGLHHFAFREAVADDVVDGFAEERVVIGNQYLVHGLSPRCFHYGAACPAPPGQGNSTGRAGCRGRPACSQASMPSRYQ